MKFSDLLSPKTGPEAIVRLAIIPFLIVIVGYIVMGILSQMSSADILLGMLLLLFLSPLAYGLRKHRRGHRQENKPRRGAERTPSLPHDEEGERE